MMGLGEISQWLRALTVLAEDTEVLLFTGIPLVIKLTL